MLGLLIWSTGMAILTAIIFQNEQRKWAQVLAILFILAMIATMCFSCAGMMVGGKGVTP